LIAKFLIWWQFVYSLVFSSTYITDKYYKIYIDCKLEKSTLFLQWMNVLESFI